MNIRLMVFAFVILVVSGFLTFGFSMDAGSDTGVGIGCALMGLGAVVGIVGYRGQGK